MLRAIADTHTLIWYLFSDPKLSKQALAEFEQAINNREQIGFSSISLIEIVYLIEKGRIKVEALTRLLSAIENQDTILIELPVDSSIVLELSNVSRDLVPDMPDRIITATALVKGVPLISRDGRIKISQVHTIW